MIIHYYLTPIDPERFSCEVKCWDVDYPTSVQTVPITLPVEPFADDATFNAYVISKIPRHHFFQARAVRALPQVDKSAALALAQARVGIETELIVPEEDFDQKAYVSTLNAKAFDMEAFLEKVTTEVIPPVGSVAAP